MNSTKPSIRMVSVLSHKLQRQVEALSFKGQYSGSEGKALHFILMNSDHDIFQKDIEEEFGIRGSSATVLLKKMERDGLITREPLPEDARYKKIVPSARAMTHRDKVVREMDNLERKLEAGISQDDLAVWRKVMTQMNENLK